MDPSGVGEVDELPGAEFEAERRALASWLAEDLDRSRVAEFVEGPGIHKLPGLTFDIERLRSTLDEALAVAGYHGATSDLGGGTAGLDRYGFGVMPLTRRPGTSGDEPTDLSGRYWIRPDASYVEVPREDLVDEAAYTEFVPELAHTYFAEVHATLSNVHTIGRMRVNGKAIFNCNSWHRDPEPRLHIPIHTNPGALFVVNHHVTHLPADGSVYFTDTRGYHTAMNGGDDTRVHIVAALPQ